MIFKDIAVATVSGTVLSKQGTMLKISQSYFFFVF